MSWLTSLLAVGKLSEGWGSCMCVYVTECVFAGSSYVFVSDGRVWV